MDDCGVMSLIPVCCVELNWLQGGRLGRTELGGKGKAQSNNEGLDQVAALELGTPRSGLLE